MNIIKTIIKSMPKNLSELEQARYAYLELGKYLSFSTKYNNTSAKELALMSATKFNIRNIDNNQVTCHMWSKLYSKILDKLRIDNIVIDQGHKYVEFYINNKKWIADATFGEYTDLSRIKNGDMTAFFGPALYQKTTKKINHIDFFSNEMKELEEIDKKFNFYNTKKEELLKLKKVLEQGLKVDELSLTNNSVSQRLEYLFEQIGELNDGYYESKHFVHHLELEFFTEEELSMIHGVELKRTNENKEVDIVQCIYIEENNCINYYLLSPNNRIKKVNEEQIIALSILGYGIDNKQIPGVMFPKNFELGVISQKESYAINQNKIMSILEFDKEQLRHY